MLARDAAATEGDAPPAKRSGGRVRGRGRRGGARGEGRGGGRGDRGAHWSSPRFGAAGGANPNEEGLGKLESGVQAIFAIVDASHGSAGERRGTGTKAEPRDGGSEESSEGGSSDSPSGDGEAEEGGGVGEAVGTRQGDNRGSNTSHTLT